MQFVGRFAQLLFEALPFLLLAGLVTACLALHGRGDERIPRFGGAAFRCSHGLFLVNLGLTPSTSAVPKREQVRPAGRPRCLAACAPSPAAHIPCHRHPQHACGVECKDTPDVDDINSMKSKRPGSFWESGPLLESARRGRAPYASTTPSPGCT